MRILRQLFLVIVETESASKVPTCSLAASGAAAQSLLRYARLAREQVKGLDNAKIKTLLGRLSLPVRRLECLTAGRDVASATSLGPP